LIHRAGADHHAVAEQVQRDAGEDAQRAALLLAAAGPGLDEADGAVEGEEGNAAADEGQQWHPRGVGR
jgi:hypothetical protein